MSLYEDAYLESGGSTFRLRRFSETPVIDDGKDSAETGGGKFSTDRTGLSIFPYGPSSGGMVESVYFDILTLGEKIEGVNYDTGYKNRSIRMSGLTAEEGILRMERMNGVHAAAYSSLYCDICERAMKIDVPDNVKLLRVAMMEIERIASHLFLASRLTGGASQNIAHMNILFLREELLRIIAETFGHRYFFGINRLGGIGRDVDLSRIYKKIREISGEYRGILETLMDSRIFIDRLDRTAIIKGDDASGPTLRGAGNLTDGRKHHRYYEGISFNVSSSKAGDSLSRFIAISREIRESTGILEQICSRIKYVEAQQPLISGIGETLSGGFMETPSGDASMLLRLKNKKITGIGFRSPSSLNLRAFAASMKGNTFADFLFGYESLGIWISEMGDLQ